MKTIKYYATTPESVTQAITKNKNISGIDYYKMVVDSAKWGEVNGFHGTLIYSNNSLVDGLSVAQTILENTSHITPLVAINPVYYHPYTLAKRIATLSHMHNRRIDINWIAGGFQNDLKSLGDLTPHDERYKRLMEYALIVQSLHRNSGLVSYKGNYHSIDKLKMSPSISQELLPVELMSGTSEAGIAAADSIGALKVRYAKPLNKYKPNSNYINYNLGVRFGIIAREKSEDAWNISNERFPTDSIGRKAHVLSTKVSDSSWMKDISNIKEEKNGVYWLVPFKTYKTFCPYLVGSIDEVSHELAEYVKLGHTHIITDIMPTEEDYVNCREVFNKVNTLTKQLLNS